MNLHVKRGKSSKKNGGFTPGELLIDGKFECYTLEDERRETKVMHETCIPEGTYTVELRKFGGHHQRYSVRFPDIHKGMLEIMDVPGFIAILIHIGNDDDDTSGCLLTGSAIDEDQGILYHSEKAYLKLYRKVITALLKGEEVTIQFSSI